MIRTTFLGLLAFAMLTGSAQTAHMLRLEECRDLALRNNKQLLAKADQKEAAEWRHKAAQTSRLPKLSADGSYVYNMRTTRLLSKDQRESLNSLGTNHAAQIAQTAQNIVQQYPDLAPLVQSLGGNIVPTLNQLGNNLNRALETNTHNVFFGALTLTQPLYMGGRLKAYNHITHYAQLMQGNQYDNQVQETILETDKAYWQVVSLASKHQLAQSYLKMLQKLDRDIQKMFQEGVVTKASTLTVQVKLNEAEMALTKVDNGLNLSRMLLCQICGLPVTENIRLADEQKTDLPATPCTILPDTMQAYSNRHDLQTLEQMVHIADENIKLVKGNYLPQLGLFGAYSLMNPNVYNGFHNKFGDNFSIGVILHVPIWRWNGNRYQARAAQAEARAARRLLAEAKEKINLQLNQAKYQVDEANKRLAVSNNNLQKANENLHYAEVGFREGVIPASELLEAQTAWLDAQNQKIDAQIDIRLTETTLLKALGQLGN